MYNFTLFNYIRNRHRLILWMKRRKINIKKIGLSGLLLHWLRQFLLLSLGQSWNFISGGADLMNELLYVITSIINPDIFAWTPFIILLGVVAKQITKFPNELITIFITLSSFVVGILYSFNVDLPLWKALLEYGVGHGGLLAIFSCYSYDLVHGIFKYLKNKKNTEGEGNMEKMKLKLSTILKAAAKSSLTVYILGYLSAMAILLVAFRVFVGTQGMLDFWTETSILGWTMIIFVDMFYRLFRDKIGLTKSYWVLVASALITDILFVWSYGSVTFSQMYIRLGIFFAMGLVTVLIYFKWYKPSRKAKEEQVELKVLEDILELNIPETKAAQIVQYLFEEDK